MDFEFISNTKTFFLEMPINLLNWLAKTVFLNAQLIILIEWQKHFLEMPYFQNVKI